MIIAANFKANHTRSSTKKYLDELKNMRFCHEIRIFPPFSAFCEFSHEKIKLGSQNFFPAQNGSFTGEITKEHLDEFNINSVLIGHSERRHLLNESDEFLFQKFNFAKEQNYEIFFCIGEPKNIRDLGTKAVLDYLKKQLNLIDLNYPKLIVAYEPVWAIGTGVVAELEDIKQVLDFLRILTNAPLLYGGSVKSENAKEIYDLANCDGVLVGTASWEIESFKKLISLAD